MKTTLYILMALVAFAGNSVLCRIALGEGLMDAAGFTAVRLFSGALTLVLLCLLTTKQNASLVELIKPSLRHIKGAILLFVYALCFSYAYLILETGTGALVLFGAVQLTLLFVSFMESKRPSILEWLGVALAFSGLVYLLIPGWGTPSMMGFLLMAFSGLAWGLYTLAGKGSENALLETSKNFLLTMPLVAVLILWEFQPVLWHAEGVILAALSGAVTSGVGYAIWYAVLPKLTTTQAGVVQLLVPVLAALGGVMFAAEYFTLRLAIASVLVLGGIYLVLVANKFNTKP